MASQTLFATPQLIKWDLSQADKITQFHLDQEQIALLDQKGTLWLASDQNLQKISENASPYIAPSVGFGRIAFADKNGHFALWDNNQLFHSNYLLATNAEMLPLRFATIAVIKQNNQYKLARLESHQGKIQLTAQSDENLLPDARPVLIDFNNENHSNGQIAVLTNPDNQTYRHAVLGDDIEAAGLTFLERHSLKPLTKTFHSKGFVFEANSLKIWSHSGKSRLVSTLSGNGYGAKVALLNLNNGELVLEAESEALPSNRWQSPFIFNQQLYAVQMPHLLGRLVHYQQKGTQLKDTLIQTGFSNHAYGEYETDLSASTNDFVAIPHKGYRKISILDKEGNLKEIEKTLPADIILSRSNETKAFFLLENGEIWIVQQ